MTLRKKFTYEDAVEYVLKKMNPYDELLFEQELKQNVELREYVERAKANLQRIKELNDYEFDDDFYSRLLQKAKNIFNRPEKITPGMVFKLSSHQLPRKFSLFLDELYFVVLTNPENSFTGNDVRVIPISRYVQFVQNYDLVFTDKLISYKPLNSVAHMHLVTNILVNRLENYIGQLNENVFQAIKLADLNDYSLVNNVTIIKGDEFRKRNPIDEYFDEEYESWSEIVKVSLENLRTEIFERIEDELSVEMEEESTYAEPIAYERSDKFMSFIVLPKFEHKAFEIDDEGFIIIRDVNKILQKRFGALEIKKSNVHIINVGYERIKKMIYHEINSSQKIELINNLFKSFNLTIKQESELLEQPLEYRYAARQYALKDLAEDTLTLYEDEKISIMFSFINDKQFLEINFLGKQKVKSIEHFHFVFLSDSTGFVAPLIEAKNNQVKFPFDLTKEQL
ncbi:MAG: hypothetical protein N3F03_05410, partial [Ignavibacteria bacterium]|nr:hypothetical protein [Ignavibacteria bacterium]